MLGANAGGEFRGGAETEEFVADLVGVLGERGGRDGDAEFVAAVEGAEVVGLAFDDGGDATGVGEEGAKVDTDGGEGFFVGLVGDGEVVGEEDDAGGVGVGKVNRAGVAERHGRIFDLGFGIFDSIVRHD